MRDFILLHVNGIEHRVTGGATLAPLSTYLRGQLGLVGTKLACSEGGCGACTVLLGRPTEGRLEYEAVNSCIFFVHQADCAHVVTVEGLADGRVLSAVQQAIVDGHGVQCGFCTPGFALTLTAMFDSARREEPERASPFGRAELQRSLAGNLCRCTGYLQLLEAGASISPESVAPLADRYPDVRLAGALGAASVDEVGLGVVDGGRRRDLYLPTSLDEVVALRARYPEAMVVSGATHLGVESNLGRRDPDVIIGLGKVAGLSGVSVVDGALVVGARATWKQIAAALDESLPQCGELSSLFGSPQIRNVGTIGGNLANASPIGDFAPLLLALDAEIELTGPRGSRRVQVADFFGGYRRTALEPDELISRVMLPLPEDHERVRFYKVSRRRHFDLAIVNAGILIARHAGRVVRARIALGGVGPTVQRLPETEAYLVGRPSSLETFRAAGRVLRSEIRPISDVRGGAAYRLQLAENLLAKFYHEATAETEPPSEDAWRTA